VVMSRDETIRADQFFSRPDALKVFRDTLRHRTGRKWSQHDLESLFERVKAEHTKHFRDAIRYEEYLKPVVPLGDSERSPGEGRVSALEGTPVSGPAAMGVMAG